MESFLSLPRSAKGGLAVLLAVALLGWGIVAYSSKRQHDDAKSLENALVTLKSKADIEQTVSAELGDLRERLVAAEADLSANQQEKGEIEALVAKLQTDLTGRNADLASLEAELSAAKDNDGTSKEPQSQATAPPSESGDALSLLDDQDAAAAGSIDVATLRERLNRTMTKLSAKSATLTRFERELEQARQDHAAALTKVETLEADLLEQGVLRERLNGTMTSLSARSATLAQREREAERAKAEQEIASERIEALEAELADAETLRARLDEAMADLSALRATLAQKERELEGLVAEHATAVDNLAAAEADQAEQTKTDQTLNSLQLRVTRTERALQDSTNALAVNKQLIGESETRLAELQGEIETVEDTIETKRAELAEREQALAELGEAIAAEDEKLLAYRDDIAAAETELADLRKARDEAEAEISSLNAEIEHQQQTLADKEDAVTYAENDLTMVKEQLKTTEEIVAGSETKLEQKLQQISAREAEIKEVEAGLAALKQDQSTNETETAKLRSAISDQETVLEDLAAAKSDLATTKAELVYQKKILRDRQEQIRLADARLDRVQQAAKAASNRDQTFARLPIAAVSLDSPAVLPVDPIQHPFPTQTPDGIRLALVHFDMGSAELTPGGLRRAMEAAAWIKEQEVGKIRLVGATDTIGTRENNKALAERRAKSLLDVFAAEGIDPDRIELVPAGEAGGGEAIADQTAEPLNRCVGVFISADG